mgnify:CR=1 FL=1
MPTGQKLGAFSGPTLAPYHGIIALCKESIHRVSLSGLVLDLGVRKLIEA